MEEFRLCSECKQPFLVVDDTDALCDKCAGKLLTGIPFCRTEKNIWEDKAIKKQWQNSAKTLTTKISSRCIGPNYIQDDKIFIDKKDQFISDRYKGNDTLLNKEIVIQ